MISSIRSERKSDYEIGAMSPDLSGIEARRIPAPHPSTTPVPSSHSHSMALHLASTGSLVMQDGVT